MNLKKRSYKFLAPLWLAFLLTGCSGSGTDVVGEFNSLNKEDAVREVVFRYQFLHNESGQQQSAGIYFISVLLHSDTADIWNNGNPGTGLLARFFNNKPPVKPYSQCIISADGVKDRISGERGLLFRIGEIRWVDSTHAEADGGYFEAGLSASGNTYYLEKNSGQWIVVGDVMHWIS